MYFFTENGLAHEPPGSGSPHNEHGDGGDQRHRAHRRQSFAEPALHINAN